MKREYDEKEEKRKKKGERDYAARNLLQASK